VILWLFCLNSWSANPVGSPLVKTLFRPNFARQQYRNCLRLNCANLSSEKLERVLVKLGSAASRMAQEADWSFSPSVGGFNPDAQYKAPLLLVQTDSVALGIVPYILLDYYRATGNVEYLERGIAALRAQFPISPSENWAHVGYGAKVGVSSFHWCTGSGMAAGIPLPMAKELIN
jgi:hypothetical protein